MLSTIRRILADLSGNKSGNAILMVALGMPVLIGTSGLAVDSAQYYMWKRDLQFAVDSAALGAAWARTTTATQSTYQARALQEYNANVQVTDSFDTGPTTTLGVYDSATNAFTATNTSPNAVRVVASATKALPFSNIITGRSTTVRVEATASAVQAGTSVTTTTTLNTLTACMYALNPTAAGAFIIGGNTTGSVACGGAAKSTDPAAAIRENGNPDAVFGQLVAGGGIETSLANNVTGGSANLKSNTVGLTNPFDAIATPTGNGVSRSYSCPTATTATPDVYNYTATQTVRTKVTYTYYVGSNASNAVVTTTYKSGSGFIANSDNGATVNGVSTGGVSTSLSRTTSAYAASGPTQGGPADGNKSEVDGSGNSKIYRMATTTTWMTISNVGQTLTTAGVAGNDGISRPQPGTYNDISIGCQTIFQPGIYVINGTIDFSTNQTVTGTDVLFVMANANKIDNINSNTHIGLSGITANTLIGSYSYTPENAAKLATMLFFDPNSTAELKFNGTAVVNLNGIVYMPKRTLWFNGNSFVSGKCMMLVSDKITLTGDTNVSTFCKPGGANPIVIRPQITTTTTTLGSVASVKLVG